MIPIEQVALALNSADFPAPAHYTMQFDEIIPRSMRVETIVDLVLAAAAGARRISAAASGSAWPMTSASPGARPLASLVINAHGMCGPDGVALGTGLHAGNVGLWLPVQDMINRIWLCACEVADTHAGERFCHELAQVTHAEVIASKVEQRAGDEDREAVIEILPTTEIFPLRLGRMPRFMIDEFEGPVYSWSRSHRMQPYSPLR
jgi:hypothetical protein